MAASDRVDLGHEPDFVLGRLTVSPARRELVRDDGASEVVEHRVMQVLIALVRAGGGVVTRDELIMSCWDGRVVGDDAINRVIYRLRKAGAGIGEGSFAVETITKIGYRLQMSGAEPDAALHATSTGNVPAPAARPSRRAFAFGAAAAGALAVAGGALWLPRRRPAGTSPKVDRIMAQAWQEWNQGSGEGNNQAIGLYRHVTEIAPDYADGWGLLACCYAAKAHFSPSAERDALRQRAVAAAREALRLDPRNAFGQAAIAFARPIRGNWLIMERGFRHALKDQPEKLLVHHGLGTCLFRVGRVAEAATEFEKLSDYQLVPFHFSTYIESLWAAGRLEEAERLSAQAATVYPTHPALWFQRFYMAMYGGRTGAAIAQAQNVSNRPDDVDPAEYDRFVAVAQAIESRDRGQIDAVMTTQMRRARGSGFAARNAMQFASVLGRLDDAFTVADAYYFSRGFIVPDWGGAVAEGQSPNLDSRDTETLFLPSTRAMRADPRFDRLVEEIGLARYWRESGTQPDYRRT